MKRCVFVVRGRDCKRTPGWLVEGDVYGRHLCRQHACKVACAPGGSGHIKRRGSLQRTPIDPDGTLLTVTAKALIDAYERVTCQAGYDRTRRALFRHLEHITTGGQLLRLTARAERDAKDRLDRAKGMGVLSA